MPPLPHSNKTPPFLCKLNSCRYFLMQAEPATPLEDTNQKQFSCGFIKFSIFVKIKGEKKVFTIYQRLKPRIPAKIQGKEEKVFTFHQRPIHFKLMV